MGLETLANDEAGWLKIARDLVGNDAEKARKEICRRRVRLYYKDYREILNSLINQLFTDPATLQSFYSYIPLVGGSAFMARISDEKARPLYVRDPLRWVTEEDGQTADPEGQAVWRGIEEEADVNALFDTVARLLTPSERVFVAPRLVGDGDEMTFESDVMTSDMVSVLWDPLRPRKPLAIAYDCAWDAKGGATKCVLWDNKRRITFSTNVEGEAEVRPHEYGMIPIVMVEQRVRRAGAPWDIGHAADLEAQDLFDKFIALILVRKAHTQSHIQLVGSGDADSVPPGQVVGPLQVLMVNGTGAITAIDLQSDPSALIKSQSESDAMVAANHGISRNRLNLTGPNTDDDGFQERVAEWAQIMYRCERDYYRCAKAVLTSHPTKRLPEKSRLTVDYGYVNNRVDPAKVQSVRKEDKHQGLKSTFDHVLEDNPEYGADKDLARAHVKRVAAENAEADELMKANNTPRDSTTDEPGQTAAANGAMGPAVRDGRMSKDAAAEKAIGKSEITKAYHRQMGGDGEA